MFPGPSFSVMQINTHLENWWYLVNNIITWYAQEGSTASLQSDNLYALNQKFL